MDRLEVSLLQAVCVRLCATALVAVRGESFAALARSYLQRKRKIDQRGDTDVTWSAAVAASDRLEILRTWFL